MKLINRENGEELVEVGSHKDYASKGVAGAGLGLGIAGTAWNIICRFKDIVENKNDKDNEMFWCIMKDIHEELRGKHFDEVYATYQVDNMYHTDNKGNKITSPMFTPIDVRKLYDKKFKSINSNITFWDVYVALNAQYHDNIELYKEWFGEDNIENIKDKIIESAIVN